MQDYSFPNEAEDADNILSRMHQMAIYQNQNQMGKRSGKEILLFIKTP